MLKPVTEQERAVYTLKIQTEKAVDDLLTETYHDGYEGYLDIWTVVSTKKGKVVLEVQSTKHNNSTKPLPDSAARYHVVQGKGTRRMK